MVFVAVDFVCHKTLLKTEFERTRQWSLYETKSILLSLLSSSEVNLSPWLCSKESPLCTCLYQFLCNSTPGTLKPSLLTTISWNMSLIVLHESLGVLHEHCFFINKGNLVFWPLRIYFYPFGIKVAILWTPGLDQYRFGLCPWVHYGDS